MELRSARVEEVTGTLVKPLQVNTMSYCIVCLNNTSRNAVNQEEETVYSTDHDKVTPVVVPRAILSHSSSQFLATFNRIWEYFRNNNKSDHDPLDFLELGKFSTERSSIKFLDFPTMCQFCVEKMDGVNTILEELRTQLKKLGRIIQDSKCGKYSRLEHFKISLKDSNLKEDVITATRSLFNLPKESNSTISSDLDGNGKLDVTVTDLSELTRNQSASPSLQVESSALSEETETMPHESRRYPTRRSRTIINYLVDMQQDSISSSNDSEESLCEDFGGGDASPVERNDGILDDVPDPDYIKSEPEDDFSEVDSLPDGIGVFPLSLATNVKRRISSGARQPRKKKKSASANVTDIKNTRSKTGNVLDSHKQKAHGEPNMYKLGHTCDLCRVRVLKTDILEHVRSHVGDYLIECPFPKCLSVFSNYRPLYKHITHSKGVHCESKYFDRVKVFLKTFTTCEVCGYNPQDIRRLRSHLLEKHETSAKKFSCPIKNCFQWFTVRQSVAFHIPQHDLRNAFDIQICSECNVKVETDKMEEHLKEAHKAEHIIKCNRCPFLFSTRELLVEHLYVHRHGVLQCDICEDQVQFSGHAQLRQHYLKVHQVGKKYVCEECGNINLTKQAGLLHKKKVHPEVKQEVISETSKMQNKTFKCEMCDIVFKQYYSLPNHMISKHGAEPYSCRFCSGTFRRKELLLRHEREHRESANSRNKFKCDVEGCTKAYRLNSKLNDHVASAHLGKRPYICEICGKAYAKAQGLKIHKNSAHLGIRPYVCEICGDSFAEAHILRRHMLIHTGERPFSCDICGQRFRHKQVLTTHLEAHRRKGADFKPNGPMKHVRKRVEKKRSD